MPNFFELEDSSGFFELETDDGQWLIEDDPPAVHTSCLANLVTYLQGIYFPGINSANIALVKFPWVVRLQGEPYSYSYPMILVCPWAQESMPVGQTLNRRDDVGYPCLVSFVQSPDTRLDPGANGDETKSLNRYLLWREILSRSLRNQPFAAVPEVMTVTVEPNSIAIPGEFVGNAWVSSFIVRFICREVRGAGQSTYRQPSN